jgi:hypothetical protein
LHQLAASFILGYHGCDKAVGERILKGEPFKQSNNDYDWLGPGIYFWEANPLRGLDFAREAKKRHALNIERPFVIGAVTSLGLCLDLTTAAGIEQVRLPIRASWSSLRQPVANYLKMRPMGCCAAWTAP